MYHSVGPIMKAFHFPIPQTSVVLVLFWTSNPSCCRTIMRVSGGNHCRILGVQTDCRMASPLSDEAGQPLLRLSGVLMKSKT